MDVGPVITSTIRGYGSCYLGRLRDSGVVVLESMGCSTWFRDGLP